MTGATSGAGTANPSGTPELVQRLFADVIHDAIWFMNIHEQNHP
jgi:hypothetical protein